MVLLRKLVRPRLWLAGLLSSAVVGLAAWGYTASLRDDPLRLDVTPPLLEGIPTGVFRTEFRFSNPHSRPVRLLSLAPACGNNCCIRGDSDAAILVPPGGEALFPVAITLPSPGPFEQTFPLFADDGGLKNFIIHFRGSAVAESRPISRGDDLEKE